MDERDLAEHGRNYLLDRAEFWEERPTLPRHLPPSNLAQKLSRMPTNISVSESGHVSIISTTSPPLYEDHMTSSPIFDDPNGIPPPFEDPNGIPLRQEHTFS